MSSLLLRHVVLPAFAPASMIGLYFTPVQVLGCANRGLVAIAIALLSATAAVVTAAIGVRARARLDASHQLWMLSTLVLLVAVALLIGLA